MKSHDLKKLQKTRRAKRIRAKISGTAERPRLSVHRSNQHISLQAINDVAGVTLAAGSDLKLKAGTKTERAQKVAEQTAADLKKAGITKVVFDRGSFRYHGRIKAVAETLRQAGIEV
jgi:large subunit ribosomal protein L18